MKRLLYLFVFLSLISCRVVKDERDFQYIDLSEFIVLDSIETIGDFYDKYPVAVEISDSSAEYMIIQLNWEGQLINSYLFNDDISGQFYVDEKMKKIYAIRRYINLDEEEVFSVVAYKF